ncbi:S-adenosylmethionine decarboxylase [Taibaiella soli]|uniref:S-adenosylmethionine decarboxylase n=2 Tax=Taibaiella soli TaxID=1649169 RepID=A0A2W2BNE7_9BACT|nr:S-adenosylmethionine decarboxylase [Taibaiella soli]
MESYKPGLHIISTFSAPVSFLTDATNCRKFFDHIILQLGLTDVGSVYHSFSNGGFTAVICLTESHISIHTWPEYGIATFDVFLSSFKNDNSEKVRRFYSETIQYFQATEINKQEITR